MQFLGIDRGTLSYEDTTNQEGMSLRDYFAGRVLQSLIIVGVDAKNIPSTQQMAQDAYAMADAMLEQRKNS